MPTSCYLCSDPKVPLPYANVSGYRLTRCPNCQLIRTDGVDPAEIARLYEASDYYSRQGGSGFYSSEGSRRHYEKHRLRPLAARLRQNDGARIRYLDVGCSGGEMLQLAKKLGWETQGLEPSPVAARHASEKLGLQVQRGDLESARLEPGSFDAISLFHVLEHLPDPRQALKLARALLKPEGLLVLEVPNVDSIPAQVRRSSWHGYVLPYHLWHFSPKTLEKLLRQSGFEVAYRYTPYCPGSSAHVVNVHRAAVRALSLFKPRKRPAAAATLRNARETSPETDDDVARREAGLKHRLVHQAVVSFYWPTDQLMAIAGKSEALYVIARKAPEAGA